MKLRTLTSAILTLIFWMNVPALSGNPRQLSSDNGDPYPKSYIEFFDMADKLLKKHVRSGNVDYTAISRNNIQLNQILRRAGTLTPQDDEELEKAFWINMYNILVIHAISELYPGITSPVKVDGFFDRTDYNVRGEKVTLDHIEKQILMKKYQDARVHFILVCGAKGCPPLLPGAYLPGKLEFQIDSQTRMALNDPGFIRVDRAGKTASVSEIFRWYEKDFTAGGRSVLGFINQYRGNKIPAGYKLGYYQYDWDLNDIK